MKKLLYSLCLLFLTSQAFSAITFQYKWVNNHTRKPDLVMRPSSLFGSSNTWTAEQTFSAVETSSLTVNGYTFPLTDGNSGEVIITDGLGTLNWGVAGDNLGNHIATTTLIMGGFGISNASSVESASITVTGKYTFPTIAPTQKSYLSSSATGYMQWIWDAPKWTVEIGTVAKAGVDFVISSGTNAGTIFQEVDDMLTAKGVPATVFVHDGLYVFRSSVTLQADDILWKTDTAILRAHLDLETKYGSVARFFGSASVDLRFEGFKFDGDDELGNRVRTAAIVINAARWGIRKCKFFRLGEANALPGAVQIQGGGDNGIMTDCFFFDCDGDAPIDTNGSYLEYINIMVDGSSSEFEINGGSYIQFTNLNQINSNKVFVNTPTHITFNNTVLENCNAGFWLASGSRINILGGSIDNMTVNHGINVTVNVSKVNIMGMQIEDVTAGAQNGINIEGDNVNVSNNTFLGEMDDYAIEVQTTASGVNISNQNSVGITGNLGHLNDLSGAANVMNWQPVTVANQLQNDTTAYNQLTVNGTFYYNASSAEIAMDDNVSGTTVIASTVTFFQIEGTYVSDDLIGFTVAGSSFTYTGLGGPNKKFKIACSVSSITDTVNTILHVALFKNGTKISISSSRKLSVANDEGNQSLIDTVRLSEGDILQMRVSGDKSAVVTAEHATVIIGQTN